jgi:hypothetical protein
LQREAVRGHAAAPRPFVGAGRHTEARQGGVVVG